MAGNTRGKVKEHFEGIHRNFDWIQHHCEQLAALVAGKNKPIQDAAESLSETISTLDEMIQKIYGSV